MTEHTIEFQQAGTRLDQWLCQHDSSHSRARWQTLIREGHILVRGAQKKPNYTLRNGDTVTITIPDLKEVALLPEDIPLAIVHEDSDLIAVDKPPGLVVHPAPGHATGTLVNALLHHCKDLQGVGGERRPGIVHRIDQDTSGIMVVAKNEQAMMHLSAQFKNRTAKKTYTALAWGNPTNEKGTIEAAIGRSTHDRKKMSTKTKVGRHATTHYHVLEHYAQACLLSLDLETGRTHQIRVHLTSIRHPILGDKVYGKAPSKHPLVVHRQMLHATTLSLKHPSTDEALHFKVPWPDDFKQLVSDFRNEKI